jgi:1,4-dihydroxy-2-naphthoate octaprenyltransferase
MEAAAWTPMGRWAFALKPPSWPKVLVPMLLGIVVGALHRGSAPIGAVVLVVAFTMADLVFVILLNDVADEHVDRLKRRMFPGAGAPKTLVDGILDRQTVIIGASLAGTYAMVASIAGAFTLGNAALVPAALVCIALFLAYSFPPARMNYRGGGEALEAIGVGVALPWYAQYAVAGELADGSVLLSGLASLALASAVSSGLSDERSDRRGGKRTVASVFGNRIAKRVTEGALVLGAVLWLLATLRSPAAPWPAVVVAGLVLAGHFVRIRGLAAAAVTTDFPAIRRYKDAVNEAVRDSALVLTLGLVVERLMRTG